jgi:hypothetical protein
VKCVIDELPDNPSGRVVRDLLQGFLDRAMLYPGFACREKILLSERVDAGAVYWCLKEVLVPAYDKADADGDFDRAQRILVLADYIDQEVEKACRRRVTEEVEHEVAAHRYHIRQTVAARVRASLDS